MDNQHRKIKGYRELAQAEIDGINAIKDKGTEIGRLLDALGDILGIDKRALAIARTELQTGLMWATRAIAQPESL
ncbi:MAG: DUF7681 family protein [Pseudomonas sp.]|uniref:Acb2/Tad1 domain-containing protein n=1 Tax=Pseudomonas sp. TaxID=306 RepID=UPI003D6E89D5